MGNIGVIRPNEIQAMSAGSGLMHSEYNHSKTEPINLLQIWVFPKERNIKPRYDQKIFSAADKEGRFRTIVAPEKNDDVMWINQDAYFSIGKFSSDTVQEYKMQHTGNGSYIFVIEGSVTVNGQQLGKRDAIGVWDTDKFQLDIKSGSEVLIIDVPMG